MENITGAGSVFRIFKEINAIPRPSHHEEMIADYLCKFASERNLEYDRDEHNCVVIRKQASPGHENVPGIVLLNHMDMVCVSDGSRPFDPLTDGIEAFEDNGWLKAAGTSLGADNGIGLSMALAVLDDDTIIHGPLEVLTTTNEEDGMSGAAGISSDFIKGRLVINLDSEDYDTITIGAAGAYIQTATIEVPKNKVSGLDFFKLSVSGGLGGHSGVDINKNRINANKLVCDYLATEPFLAICSVDGGSANASISSHCSAVVGIDFSEAQNFKTRCEKHFKSIIEAERKNEPQLSFSLVPVEPQPVISNGRKIFRSLSSIPSGVMRMHDTIPGTVMTSNNIGIIRTSEYCVNVSCHTRSFSDEEMLTCARSISNTLRDCGGKMEVIMNTPGWQENPESKYLQFVDATFAGVLGFHPKKVAMHFVLEAGYFVRKFPGIQIACIGPRISGPHSTSEKVEISTVNNIWKVLLALLAHDYKEC